MVTTASNAAETPGKGGGEARAVSTRSARQLTADLATTTALVGDLSMMVLGLVLGFWIRFRSGWVPLKTTWSTTEGDPTTMVLSDYAGLIGIGAVFLLATLIYLGLYDQRNLLNYRKVAFTVIQGGSFWLLAYLGLSLFLRFQPPISRIYVVCSFFACMAAVLAWRGVFLLLLRTEVIARELRNQILFVGWNNETNRLTEALSSDPNQTYRVAGWVPSSGGRTPEDPPPHIQKLGEGLGSGAKTQAVGVASVAGVLKEQRIDVVILADPDIERDQIVELSNLCEREMVQFKVIPGYFQILVSGLQFETIRGVPLMGVSQLPLDRMLNRVLKRSVDIVGSVIGLILSTPIIVGCGLAVVLESPGSIFYRQVRVGRNGKEFRIIKLRSMRLDAEAKGGAQWAQKDDPRRLRIGAFMREWNLDEVPQFWNVLKGEMSLVGPRPERPELIANFKHEIPHYNARHAAKPGITGWAQVNGWRGNTSLVERVRFDLYYLENWSLWFDFQIMLLTFFRRDNAY